MVLKTKSDACPPTGFRRPFETAVGPLRFHFGGADILLVGGRTPSDSEALRDVWV